MALNALGLGLVFTAKDLASGVISKLESKFVSVEGKATAAGKSFKAGMTQFGTGLALVGAGAAGLAMLGPAVKEAGDFGTAIAQVATEIDAALFPQEQMRDLTRDLAQQFGIVPVDQANALYHAVALGANDAAKATYIMTAANQLAVAGVSDLNTTTKALAGSLNAFGLDASHAGEVSDAIFVAMKNGDTTVGEIASSIGRVSASAHAMGISIQETVAAMATMTNSNLETSQAVSGLHGALMNLMHPSKEARAEAARLGIQFTAAAMRSKGLRGFLNEITSSSKFTADSMSKLFTSAEGSNAMMILAAQGGANFNAIMDEMGKGAGATAKGFDIMNATGGQLSKRIEASKKVVLGMIGEALAPLTRAVKIVTLAFLSFVTHIPKPILTFAVTLFALASAAMIVVGAIIAVKAAIALLTLAMPLIIAALSPILILGLKVAAVAAVLAAAFGIVRYAFEHDVGGIATVFQAAWSKIKLFWDGLTQAFQQGGFSGAVRDELNKAENQGIKAFVIKIYAYAFRVQKFFEGFAEGISTAWNTAEPGIRTVANAFSDLFTAIGKLLVNLGIMDAKAMGSSDTWKTVGAVIGVTVAGVIEIVGAFISVVTEMVGWVVKAVSLVIDEFSLFGEFVGGVVAAIGGVLSGDWGLAWDGAKGVVLAVVKSMLKVLGLTVGAVAGTVDSIAGIFGKDIGAVSFVQKIQADLESGIEDLNRSDRVGVALGGMTMRADASHQKWLQSQMPSAAVAQAEGTGVLVSMGLMDSNISLQSTVMLDGEVIADKVDDVKRRRGATGFGPMRRED